MEKYKPLLIVILAFVVATCSYLYYADYQMAIAESRCKMEQEKQVTKVRASHLLVKTLEEANEIKAKVEAGADFGEIASQVSLCPSGQKGGDLGFFRRGQMVPEFEKAAFTLPKGQVSEPVQTDFGWHLIIVTDQE